MPGEAKLFIATDEGLIEISAVACVPVALADGRGGAKPGVIFGTHRTVTEMVERGLKRGVN